MTALPGQPAWPNPVYAWYVVGVLTVAQTLSLIDRQIVGLLIGPLKEDLGLTDFQVSLLGGPAFALFYTTLGVPIGRLGDRMSRSVIMSCGVFFWSLATMACGLARSFGALFLARVGVGVGEAALSPNAYSMIADYFPPHKLTRPTSLYLSGVWFGTGLAFIIGGAVIDYVASVKSVAVPFVGELKTWQAVFVAVGAPGLLFPLLMLTVREPVRRNKLHQSAGNEVTLKAAIAFVWTNRRIYLPLFFSLGLYSAYGLGMTFWTIEFFVRQFDMARSNVSYIYGILAFVLGMTGSMAAGWLADRLERRGVADAKLRMAFAGIAAMVPVSILFPLMPAMELAMLGVAGVVFLTPWPFGPAVASIQVITPNEMRGLVSGLYLFVAIVLGLGVGPPLVAVMTDFIFRSDDLLPYSMTATAAVLIPAATVCMHIARRRFGDALRNAESWAERVGTQS